MIYRNVFEFLNFKKIKCKKSIELWRNYMISLNLKILILIEDIFKLLQTTNLRLKPVLLSM
jgi:hypothetical protein